MKWTPRGARSVAAVALLLLVAGGVWVRLRYLGGAVLTRAPMDAPARLAAWPWPNAVRERLHRGVTHWLDRSSSDGTVLDLLEFDFRENSVLEFLLYDQDQDDGTPFDNRAAFWRQGVAAVTRRLNNQGDGMVIAATNGLFFGYTRGDARGIASHVAPVVIRGPPERRGSPSILISRMRRRAAR